MVASDDHQRGPGWRWVVLIVWVGIGAVLGTATLALRSGAGGDPMDTAAVSSTIPASVPVQSTTSQPTTSLPSTTLTTSIPTTSSVDTEPPRRPITLGFAGDTSFTDGTDRAAPLVGVHDLLREPDLMVLNLETTLAEVGVGRPPVDKPFLFRSPPGSVDLLAEAGVDVVALANNHVLDFGPEALAATLVALEGAGIDHVGAGADESTAYRPLVVTVDGWRVGLVSLSRVPCDWSASGVNARPQVAWACPPFVEQADAMVAAAVQDADVVVVMTHGGAEGDLCPSDLMAELSARWIGLGADIVVNGHPHVVQGLTTVDGRFVVRSTGNFAFPSARGLTANSAVFLFGVQVGSDGNPEITLRIEPVRTPGGIASPATDSVAQEIWDQITRHSAGVRVDDDGSAVVDPAHVGQCGAREQEA